MGFIIFIFFFILVLGLVIIFSILGFVRNVFSAIFGFGRRKAAYETHSSSYNQYQDYNASNSDHKKVFEKNEGEYVDFEEVKD